MNFFPNLPIYVQLDIALLLMSMFLCVSLWLIGIAMAPFSSFAKTKLPPISLYSGTLFPRWWDQLYTLAFLLFFAWQGGYQHFIAAQNHTEPQNMVYDVYLVLSNFLIYLPMLVRYAMLPQWQKPTMGVGRLLLSIGGALFTIYLITGIFEYSGLAKWIEVKTGAPELQPVLELLVHGDTNTRICLIVSAVILAPICEECCYRGFLYNMLKRYNGVFAATIATGLLFSAVHTALLQFIPLAVFGCVMCLVYEYTRRLWVPIVIHMLFNAISTLVVLTVYVPS